MHQGYITGRSFDLPVFYILGIKSLENLNHIDCH